MLQSLKITQSSTSVLADESPNWYEDFLNIGTGYSRRYQPGMDLFRRVRIRPFLELVSRLNTKNEIKSADEPSAAIKPATAVEVNSLQEGLESTSLVRQKHDTATEALALLEKLE
jgi:hypothetical protein